MNALAKMTFVEAKLFLRDPGAVAFGVLFPTVLLLGLGAVPVLREPSEDFGGVRFVEFWAPSALVMGLAMIGAQHVPILIATYRERGILRRLSTTPVHPGYVLLAQMIVAFASVVVSTVLLVLASWLILDVAPPQQPGTFIAALVVGYAAVLAISMVSAALVPSSSAATSVGVLIFMVLMLFGESSCPG
ncbi:MAG: ABC transporter permease [Corynebacterium sp.]|uniref:ABC transporter permease n=1 Tax=Corynebacterium sp. TaxID=1720 RepID=UPI003F94FE80